MSSTRRAAHHRRMAEPDRRHAAPRLDVRPHRRCHRAQLAEPAAHRLGRLTDGQAAGRHPGRRCDRPLVGRRAADDPGAAAFLFNNHYAVEAVLGPEKLEEVLRPAGRRSAYFWCEEAAHHHGMSGVEVFRHYRGGSPSGAGANVARVLLSPFRARAAHIVSLGPVGVEQTAPQPAPPPSGPVETARQRRKRKQHSRYI